MRVCTYAYYSIMSFIFYLCSHSSRFLSIQLLFNSEIHTFNFTLTHPYVHPDVHILRHTFTYRQTNTVTNTRIHTYRQVHKRISSYITLLYVSQIYAHVHPMRSFITSPTNNLFSQPSAQPTLSCSLIHSLIHS